MRKRCSVTDRKRCSVNGHTKRSVIYPYLHCLLPSRCFPHRIPQDTAGIGAFFREFPPFPGRKYTRNMEAVFRLETYYTGNRSFTNISRHRIDTGTCQFPARNSLERRRIHQEIHGIPPYPPGNSRKYNVYVLGVSYYCYHQLHLPR